jgi:hypothetical protein
MIPILPFIYSLLVLGLISISNTLGRVVKKKLGIKKVSNFLIIVFVILVVLNSLSLGKDMISFSADSFEELRIAGMMINENTGLNEIIVTNAGPHIAYHSEREVTGFAPTMSELTEKLENNTNINYLVFSFFESIPDYLNEFYNNSDFIVVQEFTRDDSTSVVILGYLREQNN